MRVPVANRIGEQDKGWTYAKALLAHERTAIAGVADSQAQPGQVKELAARKSMAARRCCPSPLPEAPVGYRDRTDGAGVHRAAGAGSGCVRRRPGRGIFPAEDQGHRDAAGGAGTAMDVAAYYQGVLPNDLSADQLGHEFRQPSPPGLYVWAGRHRLRRLQRSAEKHYCQGRTRPVRPHRREVSR